MPARRRLPRGTRRILAVVGLIVLVVLYFPDLDWGGGPEPIEIVVGDPVLQLDGGTIAPDAVVDLKALAVAGGYGTDAFDGMTGERKFQAVRLLDVADSNRLLLETDRGIEEVTLAGVRGTLPILPQAVNQWLLDSAVPELGRYLQSGELFEPRAHFPESIWWESMWEFPDAEGRRVVQLVHRRPDGLGEDVAGKILRKGWGLPGPTFAPVDTITPALLLLPDAPVVGVRALPAWKEFTAPIRTRIEQVLALTDEQLTARAAVVQASLAAQLGWEPSGTPQVSWISPAGARTWFMDELQKQLEAQLAEAEAKRVAATPPPRFPGAPVVEPELAYDEDPDFITQKFAENAPLVEKALESVHAWTASEAHIHLVHHPWGGYAGDALLDEVLAVELAGQDLQVAYSGSPVTGYFGNGAVRWFTQSWLDEVSPGTWHAPHELARMEFRTLLETRGQTAEEFLSTPPDSPDLLKLFTQRLWLSVVRDDPLYPQPVVEVMPSDDERPVLRLSNPGQTTLAGLYHGRWVAGPDVVSDPALEATWGFGPEKASPPFHLVLPPGTSVQVKLSWPLESGRGGTDPVYRGVWSPTHGAGTTR